MELRFVDYFVFYVMRQALLQGSMGEEGCSAVQLH